MIAPLTRKKKDGTLYTRPDKVEALLPALGVLSRDGLLERARIRNRKDPGYVPSECLVHFIRASRCENSDASFERLYKALAERVMRAVPIASGGTVSATDERIRDAVFDNFVDLLAKPTISGRILEQLAKPGPDEAVFLEVRGGTDVLIEPAMLVDLSAPGIERFYNAKRPTVEIEIIVNTRPRTVPGPEVTFEQIVEMAFPGPHEPNVVFSMTYRKAASTPHAGELGAHGSVTIKQGTVFNVTRTVQS